MLATGAPKGDHQILEATTLIIVDAGVDQRQHIGEKLMHTLLLIEIFGDCRVFAGQCLEAFFASGIRQAAPSKTNPPPMSGLVLRKAADGTKN